jgi:tRNA A-37 threonylcarbamoyl transferase component Bud32
VFDEELQLPTAPVRSARAGFATGGVPSWPAPPTSPSNLGACLGDNEIAAFAEGELDAARMPICEAHVDDCVRCQYLLTAVARALDSVRNSAVLGGYTSMFAPDALVASRYRIVRFVARGGMGEVYEAFDQELQERVALKTVVATACDSPLAERKLKAEVQLARRISHPNVCRTYDLGVHEPGGDRQRVRFLTMEFIDGESLGQRLRSGSLAQAEAYALAEQLLLGLGAAHAAGVLHGDFKSDNVMLRRGKGGELEALITDFGLARALDRHTPARDSQRLIGSPAYMAPEQVTGGELGPETDVFAFGVVFFEMLTGKLPFSGQSPLAAAINRLNEAPQAPSSQREGMADLYDQFVLRCLSRQRERRFDDAQAALSALQALPARARRLPPRPWAWACALAASGVLLGVSGAALHVEPARGRVESAAQHAVAPAVALHAATQPALELDESTRVGAEQVVPEPHEALAALPSARAEVARKPATSAAPQALPATAKRDRKARASETPAPAEGELAPTPHAGDVQPEHDARAQATTPLHVASPVSAGAVAPTAAPPPEREVTGRDSLLDPFELSEPR